MSKIIEKVGPKERRFLDALRDLFVGAKVDGESGYINLMRIKASYFTGLVEPTLMENIAAALKEFPEFREEMFDKLHAFFSRYFSRSGSICFAYTPNHFSVYEKVYTDEQDVVLFWKTHMLYYVKTDTLFQDLKVEIDGETFFFDCSKLQHKKANEKRQTVHTFDKVEKDDTIRLAVTYSEKGRKTKVEDILKALKKAGHPVKEATLEKAMRVFERQSDVDYFINKDASTFLQEQFDLWMYQYMFRDETHWTEGRVQELQALKNIAFKIIDFIAQFEDELVRVWNKPKFVRGSHYVVTLDRLAEKEGGLDVIAALVKHKGMTEQIAEWIDLGIMKKGFDPKTILEGNGKKKTLAKDWQFLPVDTKYFTSLELKLIRLFDNLDEELDGRLIKSDNYQALNTFREKLKDRVSLAYADPPYNTGGSEFIYSNEFHRSSWISMIRERVAASRILLRESGVAAVSIDDFEFANLQKGLSDLFGKNESLGNLVIETKPSGRTNDDFFATCQEYCVFFAKDTSKTNINFFKLTDQQAAMYREGEGKDSFKWRDFLRTGGTSTPEERPNSYYPIYANPETGELSLEKSSRFSVEILPIDSKGKKRVWRKTPASFFRQNQLGDFRLAKGQGKSFKIRIKDRIKEGIRPKSLWVGAKYDAAAHGTKVLKKLGLEFDYPKPVPLMEDIIHCILDPEESHHVVDYFAGSGATLHALFNRWKEESRNVKFTMIEMGSHFENTLLKRAKKLALSHNWEDGKAKDKIGTSLFLKYFLLEQYEDALATSLYSGDEGDLFRNTKKDPYTQYVFLRDEKQSQVLELDYENDEVNVDLTRLYPDIDLAETLSCVTGKWIKRITKDEVEFADGSKESLVKPDWRLLKPLIFWGPAE